MKPARRSLARPLLLLGSSLWVASGLATGCGPNPSGNDAGPDVGRGLDAGPGDGGLGDGGTGDAGTGDAGTGDAGTGDAGTDGGGASLVLRVEGMAAAESDADAGSDSAECSILIDVIDLVEEGAGWSGIALGEVVRIVYEGEARYEFSALVGGPATLVVTDAGVAEVRLVGDQPGDASPFWLALEVLAANVDGPSAWSGTWSCAPLGLDEEGFRDTTLTAPGTFTIGPAPEEAP